ncbi:TniQ family protein [Streptomyces sp. NPDC087532]|uniref:TniQ family protein n=1 Tax=Streptomyces sp. NPDC087532 TaxID=3365795 RepID=UPI00381672C3
MTDPRNRQYARAVREYQRTHPDTSLDEARTAVTARASQQQARPARIPAAPLPRPAETLPGYVQRVAAATSTHRHRAMELLGLKPGASAAERLAELARGRLPDEAVRALCAATGMTPAQAHALTAPRAARSDKETPAERIVEKALNDRSFRRGGEGKTSTSRDLAAALALAFAQRAHMIGMNAPGSLDWPGPAPTPLVLVDLPWPGDGHTPPADPEVFDSITKALAMGQATDATTPPAE